MNPSTVPARPCNQFWEQTDGGTREFCTCPNLVTMMPSKVPRCDDVGVQYAHLRVAWHGCLCVSYHTTAAILFLNSLFSDSKTDLGFLGLVFLHDMPILGRCLCISFVLCCTPNLLLMCCCIIPDVHRLDSNPNSSRPASSLRPATAPETRRVGAPAPPCRCCTCHAVYRLIKQII